jgi:ribosomal protein S18 acetylase RimI-like enzyme
MSATSFASPELQVRPVSLDDIPHIQSIAKTTWPITYGRILSAEQLRYMLDKLYSTQSLTQQIEHGHNFYMAIEKDNPIGFASFTHEYDVTYKLQKIYVLPTVQKTGAGKKLLQTVEDIVRRSNGEILLLNVNRFNPAKGFYEKHGFKIIKEEDIDIGSGYFMNDYVMGLTLGPSPEGEGGHAVTKNEL